MNRLLQWLAENWVLSSFVAIILSYLVYRHGRRAFLTTERPYLEVKPQPDAAGSYFRATTKGETLDLALKFKLTNTGKTPATHIQCEALLSGGSSVPTVTVRLPPVIALGPGESTHLVVHREFTSSPGPPVLDPSIRFNIELPLSYKGTLHKRKTYRTRVQFEIQQSHATVLAREID